MSCVDTTHYDMHTIVLSCCFGPVHNFEAIAHPTCRAHQRERSNVMLHGGQAVHFSRLGLHERHATCAGQTHAFTFRIVLSERIIPILKLCNLASSYRDLAAAEAMIAATVDYVLAS